VAQTTIINREKGCEAKRKEHGKGIPRNIED
jgi:hypothetical protein